MNKDSFIYKVLKGIRDSLQKKRDSTRVAILRMINFATTKDSSHLFLIPHSNCMNDGYDIINYGADNVLKVCNRMLKDAYFRRYHFTIIVYRNSRDYLINLTNYCRNLGFQGELDFVYYKDRKEYYKQYRRSSIILTDNYYTPDLYKVNRQKTICLGYFVFPFKDDYIKIKQFGYGFSLLAGKINNKVFDYHISTSDLCSRVLSVDSQLYYPKYKALGFPRNDIFFLNNIELREKIIKAIGFRPKSIVTFVPTHRDYERKDWFLSSDNVINPHSLFGPISFEEENSIERFLETEDLVIVAKVHPVQNKLVLDKTKNQRIIYFDELSSKCNTNLQELLAVSDVLITDYSTACFDYLLTDNPIVCYFYDYELEKKTRGFVIDPPNPICPGDVVTDVNQLLFAIKDNLLDPSRNWEKRKFLRELLFAHNDGNSTSRVIEFIKDLSDNNL